jgi:hypothetical protein
VSFHHVPRRCVTVDVHRCSTVRVAHEASRQSAINALALEWERATQASNEAGETRDQEGNQRSISARFAEKNIRTRGRTTLRIYRWPPPRHRPPRTTLIHCYASPTRRYLMVLLPHVPRGGSLTESKDELVSALVLPGLGAKILRNAAAGRPALRTSRAVGQAGW